MYTAVITCLLQNHKSDNKLSVQNLIPEMQKLPDLKDIKKEKLYHVALSIKKQTLTFLTKYCSVAEARKLQRMGKKQKL